MRCNGINGLKNHAYIRSDFKNKMTDIMYYTVLFRAFYE